MPRRQRSCPHGEQASGRPSQGTAGMQGTYRSSTTPPCAACLQYGAAAVEATGKALAVGKDLAALAAEKTKQVPAAASLLPRPEGRRR